MTKWFTLVAVFLGGIVFAQGIKPIFEDVDKADPATLFESQAQIVGLRYGWALKDAKSAPQISQVANEATVQLNYILVKQNQEVIRLLRKIAGESK